MRSVRVFTVFSVLAIGFATSAVADGTPVSLTRAPAVSDGWSGLYIGGGGGVSRVDRSGSLETKRTKELDYCKAGHIDYVKWKFVCDYWKNIFSHTKYFDDSVTGEDWDGFGTVQVGYDHLLGSHLLIGAFADVDIYFGGESEHADKFFKESFELNHTWNVGGRLGALVTPNFLLYGVGGYTQAGFSKSIEVSHGPKLDDFDSAKGWFVGGGGEVKLHRGVSLKLEYRYADYGSFDGDGSTSKSHDYWWWYTKFKETKTVSSKAEDDLEVQSVRALVVFRLDEPDVPAPLK